MEWVIGTVLGVAALAAAVFIPIWQRINAVRTAVLAAEPRLGCTIGSYTYGANCGLHADIHNSGNVRAKELSLSFPTMGVVWRQDHLQHGDVTRPHIAIPDDAPLRTTRLDDPVANLTYKDQFDQPYTLPIPLTQTARDDGRFNLGCQAQRPVVRPALTWRALWHLRKRV